MVHQLAKSAKFAVLMEKSTHGSAGGSQRMHARPEIREHLLARAMQRWALIGRHPNAYPNFSATRARKNFSRLLAKYPQIAERLGLTALSAYPPLL
jgi:hypothetical protein